MKLKEIFHLGVYNSTFGLYFHLFISDDHTRSRPIFKNWKQKVFFLFLNQLNENGSKELSLFYSLPFMVFDV